ncbi:MAG TPA: 50S ribosomal protein L1 [Fibrobacteria bacterium]|nr:50S ribosomal protein L1 [Fibrobacteria bacterium]
MKHGKKYREAAQKAAVRTEWTLPEAVKFLKENRVAKFDETVEVAMNLGVDPKHSDQMVRGTVVLPKGTGKTVRVLVFAKGEKAMEAQAAGADFVGAEDLIEKIQGGWMEFDVVVATPDMMTTVGKLARLLGPRGLMPSPKTGTVGVNVMEMLAELKAGKISYRVDKGANVQAMVGKISFTAEALEENILALVRSVVRAKPQTSKGTYVKSITISSTMSPGLPIELVVARS